MSTGPDLLIVGAGPTGCVITERSATEMKWRSVVIERRGSVGGLCHDFHHSSGVLIHESGPHYFRTDNKLLVEYLSRYTNWIPNNYIVRRKIRDTLYPFPIHLTMPELVFDGEVLGILVPV